MAGENARQKLLSFLGAQDGEPNTGLRVSDNDFGEINWKGYAVYCRG